MNLTMTELEKCFDIAYDRAYPYVGVLIRMEGFEEPELIINPFENIKTKLAYYKKAYNDNLTLKTFNGIKIIGCAYGDSPDEIESIIYL